MVKGSEIFDSLDVLKSTVSDISSDGYEQEESILLPTQERSAIFSKDVSNNIRMSQNISAYLTHSVPKTGTTAIDWILSSLFENIAKANPEEYASRHPGKKILMLENLSVNNRLRVKYMSRAKHKGRVYDSTKMSLVDFKLELGINGYIDKIKELGISASSEQAFKLLNHSRTLNSPHARSDSPRDIITSNGEIPQDDNDKIIHLSTFRDPIAASVSYLKYIYPNMDTDALSRRVAERSCEKRSIWMALNWYLATVVMPNYGYEFHTLFFNDLRNDPKHFVKHLADLMGVHVPNEIIDAVVSETSPEQMKLKQDKIQQLHTGTEEFVQFRKQYSGLGNEGRNSRKVRSASIKGYQGEITKAAYEKCKELATFHLPPELQQRFFSSNPQK